MIERAPRVMPDRAYERLNTLLEERFGMVFPDYRRLVLTNRLQSRLEALRLASFEEYYKHLLRDEEELESFVSAVTNNETYFFRAREQLDAVFGEGLDHLRDKLLLRNRLRILSAACSSGEEAYSLAFCASEADMRRRGPEVSIDAFDLDRERICFAQSGACGDRSARLLTPEQTRRYFEQDGERLIIRREFRERVHFRWGNLVDAATFRQELPYDVIFCRNVLIYFSPAAQRRAVENLISVLRPGGLLFFGHAESILGMTLPIETVRIDSCLAYRRRA